MKKDLSDAVEYCVKNDPSNLVNNINIESVNESNSDHTLSEKSGKIGLNPSTLNQENANAIDDNS